MKKSTHLRWVFLCLVALALAPAGCSDQPTPAVESEATIAALSTANAALLTQVSELSAAAEMTPVPPAPPSSPEAADSSNTVTEEPLAAAQGPLPRLAATLALASEGVALVDFRFDRAANRLYVTDADHLYVVDGDALTVLATLPRGGLLEFDERNQRLYVYRSFVRAGEAPAIYVIDARTLTEIGTIEGGAIAIDRERNRLFIGEPFTQAHADSQAARGVRVVDGASLEEIGAFEQPGAPVYNPDRNELLIVAYTVYTADPETLQVTGDLFPELTDLEQVGLLWCNGCRWADNAWHLPEVGMVAIEIDAHCAGKGCGRIEPPRWFDAATMAPVDPAVAPELQQGCGSAVEAVGPIDGRFYRNRFYSRYLIYANLLVDDLQGERVAWRDGLSFDFVNPRTGQGYLADGSVIELATLTPLGRWPAACILGYDAERGRIFAMRGNSLLLIDERGAAPAAPPPPVVENLPAWEITDIQISPNFAADQTLLATSAANTLYRSTDGGASWQRLRGGLPEERNQTFFAYFSPNFAADRTLYLTGYHGDSRGYGVWRSQDAGDRWEPLWNNLAHLRGVALHFAADFAQSQTLLLHSRYYDVLTGDGGESFHRSTDGGLHWTLVVTASHTSPEGRATLPPVEELLPRGVDSPAPSLRINDDRTGVAYTLDGVAWMTATLEIEAGDRLLALLPSPNFTGDRTAFVVTQRAIWRTQDGGATWSQWEESRFTDPDDFDRKISSAAITPLLADGGVRLYLGTRQGEILAIDPSAMRWSAPVGAGVETAQAQAPLQPSVPLQPEAQIGEPPEGLYRPAGALALIWENNPRIQQALGFAAAPEPVSSAAAIQRFERGVMVWVQENGRIYAFLDDGRWFAYEDAFREGEPESDPAFAPPAGKQQPVRGFGKVWRQHPELREAIGWALAKEEPATALRQPFEKGEMLGVGAYVFALSGKNEGVWY
ncbi:MAG: hypothetical protein WHS90_08065 [Caldilinea sp.]|uniref:hypothetical protein n=1 Tax=Caldilinea sp. TaxID=2293560 RepID=UPI00309BFFB8